MNKIKKFLLVIMAVCTLSSICLVFASAADMGNTKTGTRVISAANANTKICSLAKTDSNVDYSGFRVSSLGSKISKMDVWVATSAGATMSEKHRIYPNDKWYKIYYYTDQTFVNGKSVVFWGEQANVASKTIVYTAASY